MKLSELIGHAQRALKLDGDLDVRFVNGDVFLDGVNAADVAGLATIHGKDNNPNYFLICDDDTMDGFHND